MSDTDAISMLTALGFAAEAASEALRVCDGQVEAAANYLLTHGSSHTDANVESSSAVEMIHSQISQYSFEDGRSACTCMALTAAKNFVLANSTNNDPVAQVSASFLQEIITSGLVVYQQHFSGNAIEHLSAEEVLEKGAFPQLKLLGGIRQGILSRNYNDASGLVGTLRSIRDSSPPGWVACLITKTPETVLVCLPPTREERSILIDTHPRPHQFAANEAYARIHSSENDLWESLQAIFPYTDLGSDVPEMMAAMYNAFDVYVLVEA